MDDGRPRRRADGRRAWSFAGAARGGHLPRPRCAGPRRRRGRVGAVHRAVRRLALLAALAALARPGGGAAFANTEPLAAKQWYLDQRQRLVVLADDAAALAPVKVAVIDSGIDGTHPELAGRVVAAQVVRRRLAVPRRAGPRHVRRRRDRREPGEQRSASPASRSTPGCWSRRSSPPTATVSLAARGRGDPLGRRQRRARDQPQPRRRARSAQPDARHVLAARAGRGRVRVLEGRRSSSPRSGTARSRRRRRGASPHYPAALPHVIGVSAVRQDGSVPGLLEPRRGLQRPRRTRRRRSSRRSRRTSSPTTAGCAGQPYSDCGPLEFRDAIGTSFAAPQVSAAAALLLGADPTLTPDQVAWLLERSADDASDAHRLRRVRRPGATRSRGWGTLDVASALDAAHVDAAAAAARPVRAERRRRAVGARAPPLPRTIDASLDYWDDNIDVYRVRLDARPAALRAPDARRRPRRCGSQLWAPGTRARRRPRRARRSRLADSHERRRRRCGSRIASRARRHRTTSRRSWCSRTPEPGAVPPRARASAAVLPELGRVDVAQDARRGADDERRAAGRPSSRPRRRRRTPPRRSRRRGRGSRRRRRARRGGSSGPCISSLRFSVRPMKLSFVVTTHGAMKTSSSSVE